MSIVHSNNTAMRLRQAALVITDALGNSSWEADAIADFVMVEMLRIETDIDGRIAQGDPFRDENNANQ